MTRLLIREAGDDNGKRLTLAFRLVSGRPPLPPERTACEKFLAAQGVAHASVKDGDDRVWTDLCQMLLASNAALHVE